MSSLSGILGGETHPHPLKKAFLGWQCRVRQILMREQMGRPGEGIMPRVTLKGQSEPVGEIITLLNKLPRYSHLPEMQHMVRSTSDPAQRREKAVQYFSATYYQKAREFSDILTSSFQPDSPGAASIRAAEYCRLDFSAFGQSFSLSCRTWSLTLKNPFFAETWWHNHLFNPHLPENITILGFEPDWEESSSDGNSI